VYSKCTQVEHGDGGGEDGGGDGGGGEGGGGDGGGGEGGGDGGGAEGFSNTAVVMVGRRQRTTLPPYSAICFSTDSQKSKKSTRKPFASAKLSTATVAFTSTLAGETSIVRAEGSERFALRWFKSSKRKDEALNVLTSPAKIDSEET